MPGRELNVTALISASAAFAPFHFPHRRQVGTCFLPFKQIVKGEEELDRLRFISFC
jgi:hypothetical protein